MNTTVKSNELNDWIDNQDVILALHISPRTLQTMRSNGILPFSRIGKKIYYRRQDIIKILSDNYTISKVRNYGMSLQAACSEAIQKSGKSQLTDDR
jgi:hypothetical protein